MAAFTSIREAIHPSQMTETDSPEAWILTNAKSKPLRSRPLLFRGVHSRRPAFAARRAAIGIGRAEESRLRCFARPLEEKPQGGYQIAARGGRRYSSRAARRGESGGGAEGAEPAQAACANQKCAVVTDGAGGIPALL